MFKRLALLSLILPTTLMAQQPYTGMALLPLQNERFPVKVAARVLQASPNPTFAFVHMAFGRGPQNVHFLIDSLESHKAATASRLRVSAYATCGPCRPPRRTGTGALRRFRPQLDINGLNRALERGDRRVLRAWSSYTRRFVQKVLAPRPEVEWRLYVELEDNLTEKAYVALRRVFGRQARGLPHHHFARNAMGQPRRFNHEPIEVHSYETSDILRLIPGDAVNGDGLTDYPTAMQYATMNARGVDFLLWRPEWQDPNKPLGARQFRIPERRRLACAMRRLTLFNRRCK